MNIEKQLGPISEVEVGNLEYLKTEIDNIILNKKISEETILRLEGIEKALILIRENYTHRLIKLLKHNPDYELN